MKFLLFFTSALKSFCRLDFIFTKKTHLVVGKKMRTAVGGVNAGIAPAAVRVNADIGGSKVITITWAFLAA